MANKRSINRVILVGTVGRDPEVKTLDSGKTVAKFSMVTTEVFMNKDTKEFREEVEWHNIVTWSWEAKKVEKQIKKGSLVLVEGKIKTRKWQDKEGQEKKTTEIIADTVVKLDKNNNTVQSTSMENVPDYNESDPF